MANSTFQIPVVALDIGYFSVKGASRREKNDTIKAFQFPSQCSHVSSVHKTSMGMAALSGANVTVNGAEYFVGKDVVLQTSARQTRAITENYADSPEYKALFLGGLYYFLSDYAGELRGKNEVEIRRMVAGLPMNMVLPIGITGLGILFLGIYSSDLVTRVIQLGLPEVFLR